MSNSIVVMKVGSSLISQGSRENSAFFKKLAKCIQKFRENDFDVVLVSSGAISYGMKKRGIEKKPKNIKQLQSLSAVGQIGLINAYQKNFDKFKIEVAQVLLSHSDFKSETKSNNIKSSINNLLRWGITPIVNENDSVSTEEIERGDNDQLSAKLANLISSKKLILYTDQKGLFSKDPRTNKDAVLIDEVSLKALSNQTIIFGDSGKLGRGGMKTKLSAMKIFLINNQRIGYILSGHEKDLFGSLQNQKKRTRLKLS